MLYFRNERRHGAGNLKKDLFLGHLQPPIDKNSKHLAILILEFDDVIVKSSIYPRFSVPVSSLEVIISFYHKYSWSFAIST